MARDPRYPAETLTGHGVEGQAITTTNPFIIRNQESFAATWGSPAWLAQHGADYVKGQ